MERFGRIASFYGLPVEKIEEPVLRVERTLVGTGIAQEHLLDVKRRGGTAHLLAGLDPAGLTTLTDTYGAGTCAATSGYPFRRGHCGFRIP